MDRPLVRNELDALGLGLPAVYVPDINLVIVPMLYREVIFTKVDLLHRNGRNAMLGVNKF